MSIFGERALGAFLHHARASCAEVTPREIAETLWLLAHMEIGVAHAGGQIDEAVEGEPEGLVDIDEEQALTDDEDSRDDGEDAGPEYEADPCEEVLTEPTPEPAASFKPPEGGAPEDVLAAAARLSVGIEASGAATGGWSPRDISVPGNPPMADLRGQQAGISDIVLYAPDPERKVLDLARSIALSCRVGEPYLAFRPARQPFTAVLLLADGSSSMGPWSEQTAGLRELIRQTPGLASWTVLQMDLSGQPSFWEEGSPEGSGAVDLARWAHPSARMLVLIWTDGLAPGFLALGAVLAKLPTSAALAWLHPWPRESWRRTPEAQLRLYRPQTNAGRRRSVPVLVAPATRGGWQAVGTLVRGGRPRGLPLLAFPTDPAATLVRGSPPSPGDANAWAGYLQRLKGHLHPQTVQLLGLMAAFPAQRFVPEAVRALAAHGGLDTSGFLLAEALTSGVLSARDEDGHIWYEFRDEAARARAALFIDYATLQGVIGLQQAQLARGAIELPVLTPVDGGTSSAEETSLTVQGSAPRPQAGSGTAGEAPIPLEGPVVDDTLDPAPDEDDQPLDLTDGDWFLAVKQAADALGLSVRHKEELAKSSSAVSSRRILKRIEIRRRNLKVAILRVYKRHVVIRIRCRALVGQVSPVGLDSPDLPPCTSLGWIGDYWHCETTAELSQFVEALRLEWQRESDYSSWLESERSIAHREPKAGYNLARALLYASGLVPPTEASAYLAGAPDWFSNLGYLSLFGSTRPIGDRMRASLSEGVGWLDTAAGRGHNDAASCRALLGICALEAQQLGRTPTSALDHSHQHSLRYLARLWPAGDVPAPQTVREWTACPAVAANTNVLRGRARLFASGVLLATDVELITAVGAAADTGSEGARWLWANLVLDAVEERWIRADAAGVNHSILALHDAERGGIPGIQQMWHKTKSPMTAQELAAVHVLDDLGVSPNDLERAQTLLRQLCANSGPNRLSMTLAWANRLIEGIGTVRGADEGRSLLAEVEEYGGPDYDEVAVTDAKVCRLLRAALSPDAAVPAGRNAPSPALTELRHWRNSLVHPPAGTKTSDPRDYDVRLVTRLFEAIATGDSGAVVSMMLAEKSGYPLDWASSWSRHLAGRHAIAEDVFARLRSALGLKSAPRPTEGATDEEPKPDGRLDGPPEHPTRPEPAPPAAPPDERRTPDAAPTPPKIPHRTHAMSLPKRLQPALRFLEKDLLERTKLPGVQAGLQAAWQAERDAGETGQGFDPWRRARVTQIAVAWVLSVVFVRTLEDRGLIDPRIAGPDAAQLASARDREVAFTHIALNLGPREYLLAVFRELAHLPGAREVFDARHNPVWVLAPSSEGVRALLDFFQQPDATTGAPMVTFPGTDTRFLGDLYQDLSEAVRKRYALLQTPEFVEEFILEQTLTPAVAEFGLAAVRLLDPTCGSGHFLLGGFRSLLSDWQRQEPTTQVEELARRAIGQVYGVDINPYAVAIARFRLVLAVLDAVGVTRLDRAPEVRPRVVVADSLLHRLKGQQRLSAQVSMTEWATWGDALFRLSEPGEVAEVLGQRYHAVVGNPPYIREADTTKRRRFLEMYASATGKYTLSAPFVERLFELAVSGGFVGMINSDALTKRDFGQTLIRQVLPRFEVTKVISTAGVYIPGHGTPTLLLFGRNRPAAGGGAITVLGKRGEASVPDVAARAPVWSEIVEHHDEVGYDGRYVSVELTPSAALSQHPWVLKGGGVRHLKDMLDGTRSPTLGAHACDIDVSINIGHDEVFLRPKGWNGPNTVPRISIAVGDEIRDWSLDAQMCLLRPFSWPEMDVEGPPALLELMWPWRRLLQSRVLSGTTTVDEVGSKDWFDVQRLARAKHRWPLSIAVAFVATHNNFVINRGERVFKRSAPIIKLPREATESDHQSLLGYLNSSTVGFWCRLVMFPKGGDQVGDGARLSKTPWQDRLEYAGNLLQQLPVPSLERLRHTLLKLVIDAENVVREMGDLAADKAVAATLAATPTLAALRYARTNTLEHRAYLRGVLVSLQEEMDWRVYGLFGLPTVTAPADTDVRVPVEPNHRPFEVRLARDVATDISASEWFRIHKRPPPADVGGPLEELYRQRLRLLDHPEHGRQLRLLETPETKRRWSPPDDTRAFKDAVRAWLLDRIEGHFRSQTAPELRSARQLALDLGRDPAIQAAHEFLTEESGLDLARLLADLVEAEGVPFLAGWRYTETGMEKRAAWEETWRLQRLEDAGAEAIKAELQRLTLKAIPVPDKYTNKDFQRHYWGLRGKLDVPKERFVSVPGGTTDDDPTPLVGWAGWDHLQVTQALVTLYQRRKGEDGWANDRLVPLLAGLAERLPWLLQWHDEPAEAFRGRRPGQSYEQFLAREAHNLGVAVEALRTWTPPAVPKRKTLDPDEVYAALLRWTPEVDEDAEDDDDAEPPAGPTGPELASEVGAALPLVTKALKKLEADLRVEKLDGRPARYVAVGAEP